MYYKTIFHLNFEFCHLFLLGIVINLLDLKIEIDNY